MTCVIELFTTPLDGVLELFTTPLDGELELFTGHSNGALHNTTVACVLELFTTPLNGVLELFTKSLRLVYKRLSQYHWLVYKNLSQHHCGWCTRTYHSTNVACVQDIFTTSLLLVYTIQELPTTLPQFTVEAGVPAPLAGCSRHKTRT